MTRLAAIMIMLGLFIFGENTNADIYRWTDENGVAHYSNHAPPPDAELVLKSVGDSSKPEVETEPGVGETETSPRKKQETLETELAESNRKLKYAVEKIERLTETHHQELAEANRKAQRAIRQAEDLERRIDDRKDYEPARIIYIERAYVPVAGDFGRHSKRHHKAVDHRKRFHKRIGRKHHDDKTFTESFYQKGRLRHASGIHPGRKF
jgi:hypothetical protein